MLLSLLFSSWTFPLGILAYLSYLIYQQYSLRKRLPPGPKPFPILGNISDFPPAGTPEFEHWLKHKDLYGGISSVTALGTTLVIIHDKTAIHTLLEKTASVTSGRPSMTFANELCGYGSLVLCQGYNNYFRKHRKLLHRELGTSVLAANFRSVQEVEVNRQLVRALNRPEKWLEHLQAATSATVLKMAYGYTIDADKTDYLVTLIEQMGNDFSHAAAPMAWMVDLLPAMQHLPENFPGAGFKKTARRYRDSVEAAAYIPYRFVQRKMGSGSYNESFVSKLLEQSEFEKDEDGVMDQHDEKAIIWTAASLYAAASDTTVITLSAFTLAMILFPHVQQKAQEEIDRVIGSDRLPTFEDRESLPYVDALVKEALRWWPITPIGFPHTADADIEYDGYLIPKGSALLPNSWWFLNDPSVYKDPKIFDPERFLSPRNEPDPASDAFGYGRRICPGRFFADAGMYLTIVRSLAAFRISKAVDEDGNEIPIDVKVEPGILSHVKEFKCAVTPRSPAYVDLIKKLEAEDQREPSDAEFIKEIKEYK